MAKRNIEEEVARLSRLQDSAGGEEAAAAVRKGLRDRVNLVAARAAQVAGELKLKSVAPDMVAVFHRLVSQGAVSDPQCWAKNAIAKALTDLDHDDSGAFLPGCRYVQMEAVWGGKTDTAVTLRSLCTLALVQCADLPRADKFRHILASVTDPAESVRIDALRALEQMEGEEAALLLRLKAGLGDPRAAVLGQAIESLLRLEGARALDFAGRFLVERDLAISNELDSTPEEKIEEAALAIGSSRLPAAVEVLKGSWTRQPKMVFLQAISVSRQQIGFDFLLELVRSGRERDAANALAALAIHRNSTEIENLVRTAVQKRASPVLQEKMDADFSS